MTEPKRSLEFEIEVNGTPEEVWAAIATGPGISSWYVPHRVDERVGGAAIARFGPGPEMEANGRVAAWEPPHRFVIDSGDAEEGLAFEWLVEARDGGSCVVRLVNSGFGSGADWDAQYDGMNDGWPIFLRNLQLHLEHFSGQSATASLPSATVASPRTKAWEQLTTALGVSLQPEVGERIEIRPDDSDLHLAGEVVEVAPSRITLLLDEPVAGTAFVSAEGSGDHSSLSVWSYLYGPDGLAVQQRDDPRWHEWFARMT